MQVGGVMARGTLIVGMALALTGYGVAGRADEAAVAVAQRQRTRQHGHVVTQPRRREGTHNRHVQHRPVVTHLARSGPSLTRAMTMYAQGEPVVTPHGQADAHRTRGITASRIMAGWARHAASVRRGDARARARAMAEAHARAAARARVAARARALADARADARAVQALEQRMAQMPLLPDYQVYTVQPGDTVASIARRFHDVAWLIRRRNGGLWAMAPGQQIRVWQWPFGRPYFAVRMVQIDHPQYYTVQSGDTLSGIAAGLHADYVTLAAENGLSAQSTIYAGQTLVLHHYTYQRRRALVPVVPASLLHTGLLLTDVSNLLPVDAALVKGVAWHETGWRMVRGASGEIGMMQIMPYMARWVQRALVGYKLDPNVPENNVLEGALLLGYYLDITGHDTHKALALYHSGDTRANRRNGLYIRGVLSARDYFYHNPRLGF